MSSSLAVHRNLRRRLKVPRTGVAPRQVFLVTADEDEPSNNFYDETTIKNIPVPNWFGRSLYFLTPRVSRIQTNSLLCCDGERNPPSLFDLSTRCIAKNADLLHREAIQGLAWPLGKQIWKQICETGSDSFRLCAMFCEEYGKESDFHPSPKTGSMRNNWALRSRQQTISAHPDHLNESSLVEQLSSKDYSWLVLLSFAKTSYRYTRSDLFALSDLPNLAALDFSTTGPVATRNVVHVFDDIVARQWARNATSEKRSFTKLKLLVLNFFNNYTKSPWTGSFLETLYCLPSLKYIDLSGSKHLPMDGKLGNTYGWELHHPNRSMLHADDYVLSDYPHIKRYTTMKRGEKAYGLRDAYNILCSNDTKGEETCHNSIIIDTYLRGLSSNESLQLQRKQVARDMAMVLPFGAAADKLTLSERDIIILERKNKLSSGSITKSLSIDQQCISSKRQGPTTQSSSSTSQQRPRKIKKGKGTDIADLLASFT